MATASRVSGSAFRLSNLPTNGPLTGGTSLSNVFVVHCRAECGQGRAYTPTLTLQADTPTLTLAADSASGGSSGIPQASCPAALQWSVLERWNGGFKVSFTLTAQQDLTSWAMLLSLSGDIDRVEVSVTGCSPLVGTLTGWR